MKQKSKSGEIKKSRNMLKESKYVEKVEKLLNLVKKVEQCWKFLRCREMLKNSKTVEKVEKNVMLYVVKTSESIE